MDDTLIVGIVLAICSQTSSIGKGLQKKGVGQLPELNLCSKSVMAAYCTNRTWMLGVAVDLGGALCGLGALSFLPISMAQPIFCNGLVVLAMYSRFCLKERLERLEWISIALCFVGIVLLAVTLTPRDWSETSVVWLQLKLFCVLLLCLALVFASELYIRFSVKAIARGKEAEAEAETSTSRETGSKEQNRTCLIEVLVGLQAGLCIGAGNSTLASGLQSFTSGSEWIDQVAHEVNGSAWRPHDGHEPLHEEINGTIVNVTGVGHPWPDDVPYPARAYMHLAFAVLFAVFGAIINGIHPVFANRGYKHGRIMIISTSMVLVSMTTGVVIGIGVLDEPWPEATEMSALRGLAFGLMFLGACCMGFARKVPRGKSVVIKGADVSKAQADGGESGEGDSGGAAVSLGSITVTSSASSAPAQAKYECAIDTSEDLVVATVVAMVAAPSAAPASDDP